ENTTQNLNQAQSLVDDASRIVYRKVVQDVDNQIVWLVGKRLDDRFKVNENTQTIIKIQLV
ncbi:MAG: hypothetical protein CVU07_06865, partial [Bacteroidetes bacterium HGW-Bacteroidetes-23]